MKYDKKKVDTLFDEWMEDAPHPNAFSRLGKVAGEAAKANYRRSNKERITAEEKLRLQKMLQDIRSRPDHYKNVAEKVSKAFTQERKQRQALRNKSPEMRAKVSAAASKPQRIVKCPHCGKEGGVKTMGRWHFDNCKHKP